jgi:[protein-PII] uridylyltransferase
MGFSRMSDGSPSHALNARLGAELAAGKAYAGALRAFLDEERAALQADHRGGASGSAIVRRRTETVDAVVGNACEHWSSAVSGKLAPWCVVAIGGYGRCELSPYSDVDIVFLSSEGRGKGLRELNERLVHTLWDAGWQIGHAFRTVDEYIELGWRDLATRTSLLEARYVAGDEGLFTTLRKRARSELFESRGADFLEQKIEERRRRHAKFGESLYLQEPNIKESIGGLRDVHTMLWVVQALHGTSSFGRMRELGLLTVRQEKKLANAFDFLLRVRNELHFLLGRAANVVELTHQPAIASGLGIGGFRGASADEHLMRLYYFHARNVSWTVNLLLDRLRRSHVAGERRAEAVSQATVVAEGFLVSSGTLLAAHPQVFRDDPCRLIEVFALAQERHLALHPDLQLLVRASLAHLDRSVQHSERAADLFVTILGRAGVVGPTLRLMHELGVLGRYLPEFGKLTCLVQHDMHHRFTIDEHTLRSVAHLDEIAASTDPKLGLYRKVFRRLRRPHVVYLGLLLHDVGKPLGTAHSESGAAIAREACSRLHLEPAEAARVEFLVRHHLVLPHTAFRRDISEPKVVRDIVELVGSLEALQELFLLVCVDIRGTAPELWNEWKEALLWDLYGRCRAQLQRSARQAASRQLAQARREVEAALEDGLDAVTVGRLMGQLPERLFRIFRPGYLARIARLAHELGGDAFLIHWAWNEERRVWDVTVCTRDRHALFASLAGAFAVEEVNILDAYIHTLEDGIALDIFRVSALAGRTPIDEAFIEDVNEVFDKVLGHGVAVEALLARARHSKRRRPAPAGPPEVHFDNTASDRHTVIEVKATDRVGLLYDMLRVLSDSGLDINSAVISTEHHRVLDAFYVLDEDRGKIADKKRQRAIRERLREAIVREPPYAGQGK